MNHILLQILDLEKRTGRNSRFIEMNMKKTQIIAYRI